MLHPLRVVAAVGAITRLFSVAFLLPVLAAEVYDAYYVDWRGFLVARNVLIFALCFGVTFLTGTVLRRIGYRVADDDLQEREAYLTVGLGWLLLWVVAVRPSPSPA